jgi:hypothetical protein
MESQLGSFGLGPGDNKGILSLLTAIEQSEDHFDTGQQAFRYPSDDYRLECLYFISGNSRIRIRIKVIAGSGPHQFADDNPKFIEENPI